MSIRQKRDFSMRQEGCSEKMKLGLVGKKLGHSLSPEIHEYLQKEQGLTGTYDLLEVPEQDTDQIIPRMIRDNYLGLNVTIPYKETLLSYVNADEDVKCIGALNTLKQKKGEVYAYNTDYVGVLYMFKCAGVDLKGKKVTLLGAGGAAKAAVYALLQGQAEAVTLAVRDLKKAEAIRVRFSEVNICTLEELPGGDIIFNTTPVGMYPNTGQSVVKREQIEAYQIAADMVYNPLETEFLRLAKVAGLQTVSGLAMLVGQAIRSEELWLEKEICSETGEEIIKFLEKRF